MKSPRTGKKTNKSTSGTQSKIVDRVKVNIDDKIKVSLEQKENETFKTFNTNPNKKWYHDPNFYIAIFTFLTFALSVTTLIYTINKWDELNLGRISVVKVKFFVFRKISFEELHKKDWGYNPTSVQAIDDLNYDPNAALIPYILLAQKKGTTNDFVQSTSSLKVHELNLELLSGNLDTTNYIMKKYYKILITIQNVGQTACTIDSAVIQDIYMNGILDRINQPQNPFSLEPGQININGTFGFAIGLNEIPDKFHFNYNVYYKNSLGKEQIKRVTVGYTKAEFKIYDHIDL